ncbi:MAG: glycine cleavage system protein GcvH [Candidatus Izemoplasmatales bacterium]|nr:glycine cleavage system protein GcvH [Candidatus Izemoplasmatales bacterium]MDD5293052.1 glycine cleavage system protein GcvH [Candidatus Izemoplasmatales bacterium]
MSKVVEGLYYAQSHEWVKVIDGHTALIGISDFAQSQLGTVVFVDLPEVGTKIDKESEFGAVESVKAASDLISPVSGKVLEVNDDLIGEPERVNQDAYEAWLIKVEIDDLADLDDLLSAEDYLNSIQ